MISEMIYIIWDDINQKDDLDPLSEVHTVRLQVISLSLDLFEDDGCNEVKLFMPDYNEGCILNWTKNLKL